MKKKLAFKKEAEINSAIGVINNAIGWYFDKFYNQYNEIGSLPELVTAELPEFMGTPKKFFVKKLTNGGNLQIGDLELNPEKVFDLLNRPPEVDKLIADIEELYKDKEYRGLYGSFIDYVEIVDGALKIKESRIKEITESYSYYFETEEQFKALKLAQEIEGKINELMPLCDTYRLKKINDVFAPLEAIFDGNGHGNARKYTVNLQSIVSAF